MSEQGALIDELRQQLDAIAEVIDNGDPAPKDLAGAIESLMEDYRLALHERTQERDKWQKIAEDAIAQRDAKWISVEDRLPEKDVPVLAWVSTYYQGKGGCDVAMIWAEDDGWWQFTRAARLRNSVTHWQPLPEPPLSRVQKGENNGK